MLKIGYLGILVQCIFPDSLGRFIAQSYLSDTAIMALMIMVKLFFFFFFCFF